MKKILSMILALAMVMSLFCAVPVNAADTGFVLPYFCYDFNDMQANAQSNYGDTVGSWSSKDFIEGIAGGKALYMEGNDISFTLNINTPAFMATEEEFKISFWLKLDAENSETLPQALELTYTAEGKGSTNFEIATQATERNAGKWVYYENASLTWNGKVRRGISRYDTVTNSAGVPLVMSFPLGDKVAIDDFCIEPVRTPLASAPVDAHPYPYVTDYDMVESGTSTTATPIEGRTVSINYTAATAADGDSVNTVVTRVMLETEAGSDKYGTYATIIDADASGSEEFTIPRGFLGRKIKISVQPFSTNGVVGAHYEKVIGAITNEINAQVTVGAYNSMTSSFTTTYSLENNKVDGTDVRAIMFAMFYAQDGTMVGCAEHPIVVANGSAVPDGTFTATYTASDVNLPAPTTAKLFFWYTADGEDPSVFNTTMEEIYPMQEVSLQ